MSILNNKKIQLFALSFLFCGQFVLAQKSSFDEVIIEKTISLPTNKSLKKEVSSINKALKAEFYYQNGLYSDAFGTYLQLKETVSTELVDEKIFLSGFFAGEYEKLEKVLDTLELSEKTLSDFHYPLVSLHVFSGNKEKAWKMLALDAGENLENVDSVMQELIQVLEVEWHSPEVVKFLATLYEKTKSKDVLRYYAKFAMLHGQVETVSDLFEQIMIDSPKDLYWLNQYTTFLSVYDSVDSAAKVWEVTRLDYPNDDGINMDSANFYLRMKQYEKCITISKALVDDESRLGIKRMLLMSAYLKTNQRKRFEDVLSNYKIQIKEQKTEDMLFVAELLREHELYEQARKLLEKIPSTDSLYKAVLSKLALINIQSGEISKADENIALVAKLSGDESLHPNVLKASYLKEGKDYKKAIKLLDEYLAVYPDDSSVEYQKSLLLDSIGEFDSSIEILKTLHHKNPLDDNSQNALGYMLLSYSDEIDRGMALVKKAFRSTPRSGAVADSVGWGYYRQGDNKTAEFFLKSAYFLLDEPEILAHLIVVLLEQDKKEDAIMFIQNNYESLTKDKHIETIWKTIAYEKNAL